jgi:hypothetical protein
MVNQEPSKGSLMMIAWSIEGKLWRLVRLSDSHTQIPSCTHSNLSLPSCVDNPRNKVLSWRDKRKDFTMYN